MITEAIFRQIALSMPGAMESAHRGHPDFRVGKRIFATLGYPAAGYAMVKLTAEQQAVVVDSEPAAFSAAPGAWGKGGATLLALAHAEPVKADDAVRMAWENLERRSIPRR